jgi:hypothetical protein
MRSQASATLAVTMTPAQAARQERQVQWLREATRAQQSHYERDGSDPRFLIPVRCPACGLHLLGTAP